VRLYRSQIFLQRTLRYALFGGEPLLHKDLSKFITFLKGHGHIVSVNTNGLLLRNCGEELVSDPPHFLCISYYKENAQILEHVLPDVTRSVPVRLNYVVFEHDFTETYKVMALARKCAVNLVTIDHYVPNGVSSHVPVTIENEGYARMKQDVLNAYMRQIAIDWREPLLQKRRTKCTFFWNSVFINEKGDFSGCCLWRRSSFRPLEESMWNGSYMRQLRQNMAINRPEVKCVTCRGLYDDTSAI
jgi:MoaA/NifB/PqqE/SkfB family radical SAM enzyme